MLTHDNSALFTLYLPYLPRIEVSSVAQIEADSELRVALAALRFACKMSTDISCKINADYVMGSDSPSNVDVLSAPVGATCYLVIIVFSSFRRIFPDEDLECQRAIAEKFESLRLFSSRWGIAGELSWLLLKSHCFVSMVRAIPPVAMMDTDGCVSTNDRKDDATTGTEAWHSTGKIPIAESVWAVMTTGS